MTYEFFTWERKWINAKGFIAKHINKDHKYWMNLNLPVLNPYNGLWYRKAR